MHEHSVARVLIDRVPADARSRRAPAVRRIEDRIGETAGVERGLLISACDIFRKGMFCRGAGLRVMPAGTRIEMEVP